MTDEQPREITPDDGRNTVLVRIRVLPEEAKALHDERLRRGVTMSALMLQLATDAGITSPRGAPAEHREDRWSLLADRVASLEARVETFADSRARDSSRERRADRVRARDRSPRFPVARDAGLVRVPNVRPDDHRAAVSRSDLRAGCPATGEELDRWRTRAGLSRPAVAAKIGRSKESVRQQELKGARPLSRGFGLALSAAMDAGELPA